MDKKNLALGSNDHANNFSIRFMELLHERELVDVVLVADGQSFPAHRLILSALSPSFRNMFKQMPVNHQAYVFMNGISKQTMEDLIKYIYNGEVEIDPDSLADFLEKAKSLEIDGIYDDNYWQQSNEQQQQQQANHSVRNVAGPSHAGIQYQTSHVNRFHKPTVARNQMAPVPESSSSRQPRTNQFVYGNDSGYDDSNSSSYEECTVYTTNGNYGYDSNFESDDYDDSMELDPDWDETYDDNDYGNQTNASNGPTAKRVKQVNANIDTSGYDIVADIQVINGRESLFHNNYIFGKHRQPNGKGQQRWRCPKCTSQRCRGAVSTMDIKGVTMMKVLEAEHTHEP